MSVFLQLPRIVFCTSPVAFAPEAAYEDLADGEGYELAIRPPNVTFKGVAKYEMQFEVAQHSWTDLDTVFNGRCRLFALEETLKNDMYVIFEVRAVDAVDIYFMQPGEVAIIIKVNRRIGFQCLCFHVRRRGGLPPVAELGLLRRQRAVRGAPQHRHLAVRH